jgi:hypothetical protein
VDLLEPGPLIEFYVVIAPDGAVRLADTKLDSYDGATVALIWRASVVALTEWAQRWGVNPGGIVGDGGPEYLKLKARLYALEALNGERP